MKPATARQIETTLTHVANDPARQHGFVNPPVYKGSTVLYQSVEELRSSASDTLKVKPPFYGRFGTPTCQSFERAMAELEGGYAAVATSSGLSAITTTIMGLVKAGDHILISDSAYQPTKRFCESLRRFGIEVEYFSAGISIEIEFLIRRNTTLVYLDCPGSFTFDLPDIPAITKICQKKNVVSIVDNTWATPVYCRPLGLGADIVIHSATKYITGHSDSFLGVIVCNEKTFPAVRLSSNTLGQCAGAEDLALGLRGLRTLAVRLRLHEQQGLDMAHWLTQQPEVARVLHPALSSHPGHELWKRDFMGSTGLFSFELKHFLPAKVDSFLNALKLFGLGHSWGGFESLIVPIEGDTRIDRLCSGALLRMHVGLEHPSDLKNDLANAFSHLAE